MACWLDSFFSGVQGNHHITTSSFGVKHSRETPLGFFPPPLNSPQDELIDSFDSVSPSASFSSFDFPRQTSM